MTLCPPIAPAYTDFIPFDRRKKVVFSYEYKQVNAKKCRCKYGPETTTTTNSAPGPHSKTQYPVRKVDQNLTKVLQSFLDQVKGQVKRGHQGQDVFICPELDDFTSSVLVCESNELEKR